MTVVMVLHDLVHAANYADRVVVVDDGRIAARTVRLPKCSPSS